MKTLEQLRIEKEAALTPLQRDHLARERAKREEAASNEKASLDARLETLKQRAEEREAAAAKLQEARQKEWLANREKALAFPFDAKQAKLLKVAVNARLLGEAKGALLCGAAGTGKSAIAEYLCKRAHWDGWGRVCRFKAAEVWREAADAYRVQGLRLATEMLAEIKASRLCLIDDLGREPWRVEKPEARQLLFDLLDCALDNGVFLVVTSNKDWAGLLAHYGDDAWASRLSALERVEFDAGMRDYRVRQ